MKCAHFVAKASAAELEQHFWLAKDLKYINQEAFVTITAKIKSILKQLGGWIKSL